MHNWKTILSLAVILIGAAYTYRYIQSGDREHYHEEYVFHLDDIDKIRIDGTDAFINVFPTEGNEIRVDISGSLKRNQKPIVAEQEGSLLNITQKREQYHFLNLNLGLFGTGDTINVYINPDYYKDMHISTASKPVSIKLLKARNLSVENVSGSIELIEIECDTIKLSTVSGKVFARHLIAENSSVSSVSGSIELEGDMGYLNGSNISGTIKAEHTSLDNDMKIHNVSGSIEVKLANNRDFSLKMNTVSGRVINELGSVVLGSGKNKVYLETISGRIAVRE